MVLRSKGLGGMFTVVCPVCEKQLKVRAGLAGKKGKCPGCGKTTHLTVVRAAEELRLYVNGKLVAKQPLEAAARLDALEPVGP